MKALLIANVVGVSIAVVAIVSLVILLFKAEKKLAKHNESWMFKKK